MAPPGSDGLTRAELDAQAEKLGLDPSDFTNKEEVAKAIAAAGEDPPPTLDESTGEDGSGRPPLGQVAEEQADPDNKPRVREIESPKEGDA